MNYLKLFEKFKEGEITVNIWDDYKQKPEYDINDDTNLYVEESSLNKKEIDDIINIIYKWISKNINLEGVEFNIKERDTDRKANEIVISELNREKRLNFMRN